MCGSSGGGGSAQKREDARQQEQQEAIRRVNRMFGMYEETARPNQADYQQTQTDSDGNQYTTPDVEAFNQAMAEWQTQQGAYQGEAAQAKTAREGLYDDTKKSVFDAFMDRVNQQYGDAERQARFSLARKGQLGSSSEVDTRSRLKREMDAATINIGNRADIAAGNLRSDDEAARLGVIERIRGGMSADQAITSAQIAQKNAADAAKDNALAQALGQVFSNYADYNNRQNYDQGYRQGGGGSPYGTWNPTPGSYQGRS